MASQSRILQLEGFGSLVVYHLTGSPLYLHDSSIIMGGIYWLYGVQTESEAGHSLASRCNEMDWLNRCIFRL
jgi:hypothetical protein